MRSLLPVLLVLAGCAGNAGGKWPSLATRPGEISADLPGGAAIRCPSCGPEPVVTPPPPVVLEALPADVELRLAESTRVIAAAERAAPGQARTATAAIEAARRNPDRSGDAEVERSRYEALFMPLTIEERRLDVLADDVAGREGGDAVLERIDALRTRLAALERARVKLPE